MTVPEISAAFPFESRYVDVLGSRMHYVEEGSKAGWRKRCVRSMIET